MNIRYAIRVAALALLAMLSSRASAAAFEPTPAFTAAADQNLRTMTAFFFPSAPMLDFLPQGCEEAYRTQLMKDSGLVQMDHDVMPGLIDHMVATARAYCDREMPALVDRIRSGIGHEWAGRVSPADNARLANLFAPDVAIAESARVEIKPGETATQAAHRQRPELTEEQQRDFIARQAVLAKTPGGAVLIQKVRAYQVELEGRQDELLQPLFEMVRAAVRSAKTAANEYANERGYSDLYPPDVSKADQG